MSTGRGLMVVPGVTNRLVLLQQTNMHSVDSAGTVNSDSPSQSAVVNASYYPRTLWGFDS